MNTLKKQIIYKQSQVLDMDNVPEHSKRRGSDDMLAAYSYVDSILYTSDYEDPPAWHGWALREAFLAGISFSMTAK